MAPPSAGAGTGGQLLAASGVPRSVQSLAWSGPGHPGRPGRRLQLLESLRSDRMRLRARLLEDGYPGWVDLQALLGHAVSCGPRRPRLLDASTISAAMPAVLAYAQQAALQPNHYLWGGCLGPDFDCSGLVQTAFAAAGIWIPRDAYQQERFCQPVAVSPGCYSLLRPGDLIFFGPLGVAPMSACISGRPLSAQLRASARPRWDWSRWPGSSADGSGQRSLPQRTARRWSGGALP